MINCTYIFYWKKSNTCPSWTLHSAAKPQSTSLQGSVSGLPHKHPLYASPVHPVLHLHSYVPTRLLQIAFSPHGLVKHWFLSFVQRILGLPMYPAGHEQTLVWSSELHWALAPQDPGWAQGLTHVPLRHCLLGSQSSSPRHSARLHSTLGFPWRPCAQVHTGRWLDTRHSAVGAQSAWSHGLAHLPAIQASVWPQSVFCWQPGTQEPKRQIWPCGQDVPDWHFRRQLPETHCSPQEHCAELVQDLVHTSPSPHLVPAGHEPSREQRRTYIERRIICCNKLLQLENKLW